MILGIIYLFDNGLIYCGNCFTCFLVDMFGSFENGFGYVLCELLLLGYTEDRIEVTVPIISLSKSVPEPSG